MDIIESIMPCWQRNLRMSREGRRTQPVAEAQRTLQGMTGKLDELKEYAQVIADAHLVTVAIRTASGDLYVVAPR